MNPKDSSWTRLQSTFDALCRPTTTSKKPPQRAAFGRAKASANQSVVRLKPVPRRSAVRTNADTDDATTHRTPAKKRKPNLISLRSPRNKENTESLATVCISDNESIDFDPDHDGFLPDGGFCDTNGLASAAKSSLPVYIGKNTTSTCPSVRISGKTPRLNFANLFASFENIEVPATQDDDDDDDIEIPETQVPPDEPFDIDDADTEDTNADAIDDDHTTTGSDTVASTTVSELSGPISRQLVVDSPTSSASSAVPSAPHKHSPKRSRRRPRAGGLLEQLDASVNRAKSNAAFWQHERHAGLVEAGTAVQVLEMVAAMPDAGGGFMVRVCELHASGADDAPSMVLVIEGDLKLCARLQVGQRLEVDLRMATRLRVRLARDTETVTVYPNVQFVRLMPE